MSFPRFLVPVLVALALGGGGCRDPKIASYTVPKEAPAPAAMSGNGSGMAMSPDGSASMSTTAVSMADGDSLIWTVPADWKTGSPDQMLKANYVISSAGGSDAKVSISAFPGDVGGEAANIDRWHTQVQLPAATAAEMASAVTRVDQNSLHQVIVEFVNPKADPGSQHLIAAIIPYNGATWFFKLMGPDATVTAAKPAFMAFLQGIKAPSPGGLASMAGPAVPAMSAPTMATTPVPTADGASLVWTLPAGWKNGEADNMLKGNYVISGAGGPDAKATISAFPGDVGGEAANIDRWHGQVQLPTATAAELAAATTRMDQNGLHQVIVEFVNPKADPGSQHLIAAIIPYNGATWFFKLMGPDATVTAAKPAFMALLQSVKAP